MSFLEPIKRNHEHTLAFFALIALSLPPQTEQRRLLTEDSTTGESIPNDWSHKGLTKFAKFLELDANDVCIDWKLLYVYHMRHVTCNV